MRDGDLIGVIEALYRVDAPEPEWIEGVIEAAHASMNHGLGTASFLYDATRSPMRAWNVRVLDSVMSEENVGAAVANLDEGYADRVSRRLFVGLASEGPEFASQAGVEREMNPLGVADTIAVNAYDPSGVGIYLGALLPRISKLGARKRSALERVAVHMATALGLRLRLAASHVEAVLTPGGRVEHADAHAKTKAARSALREATVAIDKARSKLRQDGRAVSLWRARASGRWTLVDKFEADGKRFVVARVNERPVVGIELLSRREEQVLSLIADGRRAKVVAYELGIADSTVRVLARRAAQKLGARSTAQAVDEYRRRSKERAAKANSDTPPAPASRRE